MAVLSDQDRFDVWADMMRDPAIIAEFAALTKPQLREVVDAADAWRDANASSYNTALPQPQRGILSARAKAAILMAVITRNFVRS